MQVSQLFLAHKFVLAHSGAYVEGKNVETVLTRDHEEFRNSHGGADIGSSYLSYSNCDVFNVAL